jgi:CheY-like chemotaxis protein
VKISLSRDAHNDLALSWREEGEASSQPWRDPFAVAIVERTIPHELSGKSYLDFGDGFMEAKLVIPGNCIVFNNETVHVVKPVLGEAAKDAPKAFGDDVLLDGRVLLVEDNVLIGMEAEYQLQDLGAQEIDMAGNVAAALDLIAAHDYSFAVLDINLGNETSQKVAEALSQRAIPYVFTTGYGEVPWTQADAYGAPVVTKPLDPVALERHSGNPPQGLNRANPSQKAPLAKAPVGLFLVLFIHSSPINIAMEPLCPATISVM